MVDDVRDSGVAVEGSEFSAVAVRVRVEVSMVDVEKEVVGSVVSEAVDGLLVVLADVESLDVTVADVVSVLPKSDVVDDLGGALVIDSAVVELVNGVVADVPKADAVDDAVVELVDVDVVAVLPNVT